MCSIGARFVSTVLIAGLVTGMVSACGGPKDIGSSQQNTFDDYGAGSAFELPAIPDDRLPSAGPAGDPEQRTVQGSDYLSMHNGTVDGTSLILDAPGGNPYGNAWAVYRISWLHGFNAAALVTEAVPQDIEDEYYIGVANYTTGGWEWHGPTSMYEFEVDLAESGDRYISRLGNFYFIALCQSGNTVTHSQSTLMISPAEGPSPPGDPAQLSATDGDFTNRVELSWTGGTGADGHAVWRTADTGDGPDEEGWQMIGYTEYTTYADYEVTPGDLLYYKVQAYNYGGYSGYSNVDSGYADDTPPPEHGMVWGKVLPIGSDFENMTVYLAGLPEVQEAVPNVYGVFMFNELPFGNYLVTVHHTNLEFSPQFHHLTISAGEPNAYMEFESSEAQDFSTITGFVWRYDPADGYHGIYGTQVLIEKIGFDDSWNRVSDGYGWFSQGSLETTRYYRITPTRADMLFTPELRTIFNYENAVPEPLFFQGSLVP